jgi:hypothetical protein
MVDSHNEAPAGGAVITITASSTGYDAQIVFTGAFAGRRALRGSTCHEVADAALLSVAIAVDPMAVVRYVAQAQQAEIEVPRNGPQFSLGLGFGADLGTLPQLSVGPGLVLGAEFTPVRLALGVDWWLSRVASVPMREGIGGEITQFEASLRGCVELVHWRKLDFGPCVAATGGLSVGKGVNLARPLTDHGWTFAPLAGLRIRQRSQPLYIELAVDAGASLAHPVYLIDGIPIFGSQGPSLFGRVSIVLGWFLP